MITARKLYGAFGEKPPTTSSIDSLEEEFFSSIVLQNGSTKMTLRERLNDVNNLLTDYLESEKQKPSRFLDLAVSSGISTVEWWNDLLKKGFSPSMVASDLTLYAYLIQLTPFLYALVDRSGFPLQYEVFGIAFRPWCRKRYRMIGGGFISGSLNFIYNRLTKNKEIPKIEIALLSPSAAKIKEISYVEEDIEIAPVEKEKGRYDVIRAANILNRVYFSEETLVEILGNLRTRLKGPGSILVVCRTQKNGTNDATIFRLNSGGGFEIACRLNSGSEVEDLVLMG